MTTVTILLDSQSKISLYWWHLTLTSILIFDPLLFDVPSKQIAYHCIHLLSYQLFPILNFDSGVIIVSQYGYICIWSNAFLTRIFHWSTLALASIWNFDPLLIDPLSKQPAYRCTCILISHIVSINLLTPSSILLYGILINLDFWTVVCFFIYPHDDRLS